MIPGPGHGAHGSRRVIFGKPHPGQAIAAHGNQKVTNALEQVLFAGGANHRLVALAERPVGAVHHAEGLIGLALFAA